MRSLSQPQRSFHSLAPRLRSELLRHWPSFEKEPRLSVSVSCSVSTNRSRLLRPLLPLTPHALSRAVSIVSPHGASWVPPLCRNLPPVCCKHASLSDHDHLSCGQLPIHPLCRRPNLFDYLRHFRLLCTRCCCTRVSY